MNAKLIEQVKAYALLHYECGGWDVIVECWSDADIAEQISKARTLNGAIKRFKDIIDIYSDRQADGRSYDEKYSADDMLADFLEVDKEAYEKEAADRRTWLEQQYRSDDIDPCFREPCKDDLY
jgi:hypothetical protein